MNVRKCDISQEDKQVYKINDNCTLLDALRMKDYDRAIYILEQVCAFIGLPSSFSIDNSHDNDIFFSPLNMYMPYRIKPDDVENKVCLNFELILPKGVTSNMFSDDFLTHVEAMEGGFSL